jgi:hypothetical protein
MARQEIGQISRYFIQQSAQLALIHGMLRPSPNHNQMNEGYDNLTSAWRLAMAHLASESNVNELNADTTFELPIDIHSPSYKLSNTLALR